MIDHAYAVILAGGKGERFWPLSTSGTPKQLLTLVGDRSFLAEAVERVETFIPLDHILIMTNADLVEACAKAVPHLPAGNIIGEPMGRDTAAAIALAGVLVEARDPDAVFCILTADHVIGDVPVFCKTLEESLKMASDEDVLITIGIRPGEPSISYGYIEAGDSLRERDGIAYRKARRFVEKPDAFTAAEYIKSGHYYWNSGMFIWSASALKKGFRKHCSHLHAMMDRLSPHVNEPDFMTRVKCEFQKLPKISIDYALMEHADNIVMAEGCFAWDDLGSWPALENHFPSNGDGDVIIGCGEGLESGGNIVYSKDRLTALVGVRDLVVVHAGSVTLICPKAESQKIKQLVRKLSESGRYDEVL